MDNKHFYLARRYRAIMKDGSIIELSLKPERCYYFSSQEHTYICRAIVSDNIDVNNIERIECYFVPMHDDKKIDLYVGV